LDATRQERFTGDINSGYNRSCFDILISQFQSFSAVILGKKVKESFPFGG